MNIHSPVPLKIPTPEDMAELARREADAAMESTHQVILGEMVAKMEELAIHPAGVTYRYTIDGHRFGRYDILAIQKAMADAGWSLTWQMERRPHGNAHLQWSATSKPAPTLAPTETEE